MDRRAALRRLATLGAAPLLLQACGKKAAPAGTDSPAPKEATAAAAQAAEPPAGEPAPSAAPKEEPVAADIAVPESRPESWDPVAFNRDRGAAGAIPAGYMEKINAADGVRDHLGKHLPYTVAIAGVGVSEGTLGLMWGDTRKGWVPHPNAGKSEGNPAGHWYNWIRLRNSRSGQEVETTFDDWPRCSAQASGRIAAREGADPAADGGRNSVYVARLPEGTVAGDELRVWAHCLTHGEYVDFLKA